MNIWWKETINSSSWSCIKLQEHIAQINSISFSPDSKLIVSGCEYGLIKIWKTQREQSIQTLDAHNAAITSVTFSPDGKMLASADIIGCVKLWKLDIKKLDIKLKHFKSIKASDSSEIITSIDFSYDSKFLVSSSKDKFIKIWNNNGDSVKILNPQEKGILYIKFSPNGKFLASVDENSLIKLWAITSQSSLEEWKLFKILRYEKEVQQKINLQNVSFSKDSKQLISSSGNEIINFWNCLSKFDGYSEINFKGHFKYINSVNFSVNEKKIATASNDGAIKIWNYDGVLLQTITNNYGHYGEVKFNPDGKIIAALNCNNKLKKQNVEFWLDDGSSQYQCFYPYGKDFYPYGKEVKSISFSPTTNICAIAENTSIVILNLDDKTIQILNEHNTPVIKVNFNSNGTMLVSVSKDGTIKLWKLYDNKSFQTFCTHDNHVYYVNFVDNVNDKIITINSKNSYSEIKLWSFQGNFLKRIKGEYSTASISPDWSVIAVATFETDYQNRIKLWNLNLKKALENANTYLKYYQYSRNFI